jgi:hypothetical protein
MRENEGNSEKNGFEECQAAHGVRPEKGHLAPESKMANGKVCDHVLDKLHPPFLLPALNGI